MTQPAAIRWLGASGCHGCIPVRMVTTIISRRLHLENKEAPLMTRDYAKALRPGDTVILKHSSVILTVTDVEAHPQHQSGKFGRIRGRLPDKA